jgi:hypothetical protein
LIKSTITPKKGGLNGDPERVFEKIILTAEPQRTQSLFFDLFSFQRKENK